MEVAINFSKENNIVESEEWANLVVERLGDGWVDIDLEKRILQNKKALEKTNEIIYEKYGVKNASQIQVVRKKLSDSTKERWKRGEMSLPPRFDGKVHSEEVREKMSNTHKKNKHQQGEKNSQFGTIWITDGIFSKKIKKDEYIPERMG